MLKVLLMFLFGTEYIVVGNHEVCAASFEFYSFKVQVQSE